MKRKLFLLLTIWFSSLAGMSQNIVYFEYFVDEDPGYNLATPVPLTQAPAADLNFVIPSENLRSGIHFAGMRGKDQNGKWSAVFFSLFYVDILQVEEEPITYVEYFTDTDPGFGNGTQVPVTPGTTVDLAFTVDLENLEPGIHFIHVRSKSENNTWSHAYSQLFLLDQLDSGESPITYVEYFTDTDPGFGNGNPVPVTPGTTVDLAFTVDLENLEPGIHFIHVRSKSENNTWSHAYSQLFLIDRLDSGESPITYVEYFIDSDPGFGNGNPVPVTPGTTVDLAFTVDLEILEPGIHFIHVRSKSENSTWSHAYSQLFLIDRLDSGESPITYVEYFIDSDPGFGNGNPVPVTPGTTVDLAFQTDLTNLGPGIHFIHVRSKSENEVWSHAYSQLFLLENNSSAGSPNIVLLEYFVDEDPGFGSGTIVPVIQPSPVVDRNFIADVSSVATGEHKFFARAKDEYGNWSMVAIDTFNLEPATEFAIRFDGENDFLKAGEVPFPDGDLTIESWINPAQINGIHELVYGFGDENAVQFRINQDGSLLYGELAGGNWSWVITESLTILPDQWTHVAVTKSDGFCSLYINGTEAAGGFVDNNPVTGTLDFGGRGNVNDRFFDGLMDEVRIWDVARSQEEITGNLCTNLTGNEPGLFGLWHFDDGFGSSVATDSGPNGFGAWFYNMNPGPGAESSWIEHACDVFFADFMADVFSGEIPLEVAFSDLSQGSVESWSWNFGDGSASNSQNPVHNYEIPGSFTVSLTVSNSLTTSTRTRTGFIEATIEPLVPDFVADITSGFAPLTVIFTDLSTGNPETWFWDFGDGTFSDEQNPVHTFNNSGIYDISLTVSNAFETVSTTSFQYIEVFSPEPLIPDFVADVTSGFAPLTVNFTDLSTGNPETWFWDFGDGNFSEEQNPVHTYTSFGYYTVNLSITKGNNTTTITKNDYISVFQTQNGDWSLQQVCIENTPEAALMIRAGDIDNLGFGWPDGFDPFSGESTPGHDFPWSPVPEDAPGTDRIIVVSGYTGNNVPCGTDGYTNTTSRPENLPESIIIHLCQPPQSGVNSAVLQIFVDDFQPQTFCSEFSVKMNGYTFENLQTIVNYLDQTGPIGRMLTVRFPDELLYLLQGEQLELEIDDPHTGAGDGFAIDFVKLLINEGTLAHSGSITGTVYDLETAQPVEGAEIEASFWSSATTGPGGNYTIQEVPTGMVYLECRKEGHITGHQILNLESGTLLTADFWLEPQLAANFEASPTSGFGPLAVQFTDLSTGNPEFRYWDFGDGAFSDAQNPVHTYITTGWFDVTLTVSKGNDQDIIERQAYIHVAEMPLGEKVAEYFFDVDPGFGFATPVYSEDGFEMVNFMPDVSELPDGTHTLYVRSRNENGNWSQTLIRPFLKDRLISDNPPVVERWEYFVDVDPGFGNGIFIEANHLPVDEFMAEIPLQDYSNGLHNLFFRALDNHGKWSETLCRSFLKTTLPGDISGITRMEYFIDDDPGLGLGHPANIQQVGKTVVQNFLVNLSMQEAGEHRLFVRSADNQGRWSLVLNALFTVEAGTGMVQIIDLKEGWSGISGYVVPDDPSLESLFAPIVNDLVIFQNFGGMYWPANNINTLVNWNSQAGYQVKMNAPQQLTLSGNMQQELTLALDEGWNYLPVPTACTNDVISLFEPVGNHLRMVKEIAGWQVYWPQFGIVTLSELQPGKAYFVNLDQPVNLTFPVCTSLKASSRNYANQAENMEILMETGLKIASTPLSHIVALARDAATGIEDGDVLMITNHGGLCCGAAVYHGENLAITVFGDDPTTIPEDGFMEGEPLLFSLYDPETGQERSINIRFDEGQPNAGNFINHGISAIRCLKVGNHNEYQEMELFTTIAPNPSNGIFHIIPGNPTIELSWQICNAKGKVVITGLSPGGRFNIDLSNSPKGIYFLKIVFNGKQVVKKLVLN